MEEPVGPESDHGSLEMSQGERRELLSGIMRKQAGLSARVAIVFIAILAALPLVNLKKPGFASREIHGFTFTWLILGVLFYPVTWILSYVYVKNSEQLEAHLVKQKGRSLSSEGGR